MGFPFPKVGYVNSPEGIDDIQLGFLSTLSIPANSSASGGCASLSIEKSLGKQFSLGKKTNRWNLFKAQFSTFFFKICISGHLVFQHLEGDSSHIWHISWTYRFAGATSIVLGVHPKTKVWTPKRHVDQFLVDVLSHQTPVWQGDVHGPPRFSTWRQLPALRLQQMRSARAWLRCVSPVHHFRMMFSWFSPGTTLWCHFRETQVLIRFAASNRA